mmetsp:Transcript_33459/g.78951  ORF Transcript_33459/g.78951 Transcript_33459/m.78951 type:complete len:272 (-) Transcript_33459:1605-2420(-)
MTVLRMPCPIVPERLSEEPRVSVVERPTDWRVLVPTALLKFLDVKLCVKFLDVELCAKFWPGRMLARLCVWSCAAPAGPTTDPPSRLCTLEVMLTALLSERVVRSCTPMLLSAAAFSRSRRASFAASSRHRSFLSRFDSSFASPIFCSSASAFTSWFHGTRQSFKICSSSMLWIVSNPEISPADATSCWIINRNCSQPSWPVPSMSKLATRSSSSSWWPLATPSSCRKRSRCTTPSAETPKRWQALSKKWRERLSMTLSLTCSRCPSPDPT